MWRPTHLELEGRATSAPAERWGVAGPPRRAASVVRAERAAAAAPAR